MSEAKIGLITVVLIIIAFATMLRRKGALSTVAAVSAILLSIAIASYLFVSQ